MSRPVYERLAAEDLADVPRGPRLDEVSASHDDDVYTASVLERKRLWWRNAVINTLFIASWFFFATILSVYNKWMFSPDKFGFIWPFFVTSLHMLTQFALSSFVRFMWPKKFKPPYKPSIAAYAQKVAPTAVTTSLDIGLSNVSLGSITLSFYTMCKSSSLIFVLSFAFLFHLETFSLRLIGVILLIFTGVLMMVATETQFDLPGFLFVISASALGGLRWSLTQLLLRDRKLGLDTPVATLFWMSPLMAITLATVSFVVDDWWAIFTSKFFVGAAQTAETMFFLVVPGVIAFCMVLSEIYIIQRAGVVPMSIAGIAKEVTTISISAWLFHDELTPLNLVGVSITVCGIILFTYHKYQNSVQSKEPLDSHGAPLLQDEEYLNDGISGGRLELMSRSPSSSSLRTSVEQNDRHHAVVSKDVLFTVDDDDDEEENDEEERSSGTPSSHSHAAEIHASGVDLDPWTSLEESHEFLDR